MTFSRRSIFAAIAALPLFNKLKAAKKPEQLHHPADVRVEIKDVQPGASKKIPTGLWIHIDECSNNRQAHEYQLEPLGRFIRYRAGTKHLVHYSYGDALAHPEELKKFRDMAISSGGTGTILVQMPPRADVFPDAGLPTYLYFRADVITYKPLNGPVKFIKCRWTTPDAATLDFHQNQAIYNAIVESVEILQSGSNRAQIPNIIKSAIK